jgi:hypothetical protein
MRFYVLQSYPYTAMLTEIFYHATRSIVGKKMKDAISLLVVMLSCGVGRADDTSATISLEDRLQSGAIP